MFDPRLCALYDPVMAKHTSPEVSIITDPLEAAKAAKLRYVSDSDAGITRERHGKGFTYLDAKGKRISEAERERVEALVIPPAWEDVWICPSANGHILATGRDQKGRKQYLYHPRWREVRDETKFNRMILFGEALPKIRQTLDKHLKQPGLPREKVLAAAVRVMEQTMIRIGNEEYVRENESYGLTTLRDKHVTIEGPHVTFEFRGKSGKDQTVDFTSPRLARIIRQVKDLPGYELFQYVDDEDQPHDIGSEDVNAYLREVTGEDFTAKDFRTWGGTVLALTSLFELAEDGKTPKAPAIVKHVAEALGNTRAVCKKYYIHPSVLNCCDDDDLYDKAQHAMDSAKADSSPHGLTREEAATIAFLKECA
jgi:DNA topoisomerase I